MKLKGPRSAAVFASALLAAAPAHAIVGGAEEPGGLARSTVMVLSSNGGVCSAVVIDADVVLTAAHCAAGSARRLVHWREGEGPPALVEPVAKAVHPGYEPKAVETRKPSIDLALLRLPEALPGRFAAATLSAVAPEGGARIRFGGYGVAREGDARSTGTFRAVELTVIEPYGRSRILVWAKGDGGGACTGDSGGPVTQGDVVFAVATWARGAKARACGDLSQGVLLGPQRGWIDRILASWGRKARWR